MDTVKVNKRIMALDILRGITIAGMILVNNPGAGGKVFTPLRHATWNGITPTDLIFPFFMFIMGISTYISLKKYNFTYSHSAIMKILKRTFVIFFIGLALSWFTNFCYYWVGAPDELTFFENLWASICTFDYIRILGVMQRLALSYGATAIIALTIKHKNIPYLIVSLLVGYFMILMFGNGYEYNETNILSIVDRAIITPAHMYSENGIEPEGILSTIPSIAHVLLGFYVGKLLLATNKSQDRMSFLNSQITTLFLLGTVLTFAGLLLDYGCPINKKIWSPSFVLTTCGFASSFLALLIWIIDVKGAKKWTLFFESFGVNPLFLYVLGCVLSVLFNTILIPWDGNMISIYGFINKVMLIPIFGQTALCSLVYSVLFVALNWCIGYPLYKNKIYIKI